MTFGNGTELYIALIDATKNLEPMFPNVNDNLAYFQISRVFSLFVVFLRLLFCMPVVWISIVSHGIAKILLRAFESNTL